MTEYERWLNEDLSDKDLTEELLSIKGNDEEINDRFYRDLEFGTAGLRGVIGAGTNRMNVYTVAKATQGLSNYLLKHSGGKQQSVAIAYDSRNKGVLFSEISASVLAANGIKAYIYSELMPTPALSWAVRYLKCDSGICVTASHNPAKYNGYKAYGSDGCQITSDMADGITSEINSLDIFSDIKYTDFHEAERNGLIEYIKPEVTDAFLDAVYAQSLYKDVNDLKVVYTPLNGAGKKCVTRILDRIGVKDITIVPEQSEPDGNFPTAPYPNPEFVEALHLGIELSKKVKPDLLLATDPDSDRVGTAVEQNGEYVLPTGNEIGVLLLDFMARMKKENGTLSATPVAVTTIVSTDMVESVAADYGVKVERCLTGFKFIGDIIADLESRGRANDYIIGFEESYGYLPGGYVRDKDAVAASMLICEMASYYKKRSMSLMDAMEELYKKHGYYINDTLNFAFEGEEGMNEMSAIMENLRKNPPKEIAGLKVVSHSDYGTSTKTENGKQSEIALPKSNVLQYMIEGGHKFTVRPSGTEPKIKIYLSAKAATREAANAVIAQMKGAVDGILKK